jgi:hypothetical protein
MSTTETTEVKPAKVRSAVRRNATRIAVFTPLAVGAAAVPAFATGFSTDPVGIATTSLSGSLLSDAAGVLPYAAGIAAVMIGWRLVRKALKF